MKTLLVSEIFPPKTGGSGRWFWEIYRRLARADVLIAAGEDSRAPQFDSEHDLNVIRVPLAMRARGLRSVEGLRGYARGYRRLVRLVRPHGIERIHAARCLPEGLMARLIKLRKGTPYLVYVHGEELGTASTSRELTWLTRKVLAGTDFVVANSHNSQRILCEEWQMPADKVRVLHPGVDTKRFVPAPPDDGARQELGWDGRTVVVTVGRLQKRKGHDMLIRALPAVRQAIPRVLYALIGDGEERSSLEALAREQGVAESVQFLGEPDDDRLIRCYQQCDLFALPNRSVGKDIEGFGMVLLEAQACGRPVLAGASGGTAETMRVPETGRIVPCERPDELAGALVELLADAGLRARMGLAARQWVVDRFDWEPLARQAERLFAS